MEHKNAKVITCHYSNNSKCWKPQYGNEMNHC